MNLYIVITINAVPIGCFYDIKIASEYLEKGYSVIGRKV